MLVEDSSEGSRPSNAQVDTSPARRPARTTIEGRRVTLAPLDPYAHGNSLYEGTRGESGERLWQYLFEGPFSDRTAFDSHLQRMAAFEDPLFFAIVDSASARALGYAAYMRT